MKFLAAILATLGLITAAPALAETAFAPGQVWTLKGDAYPGAVVEVGKTETVAGHAVVHITVLRIPVTDAAGQPARTVIAHMPFDETALRKSVGDLVQTYAPPFERFQEGYDAWKSANGGVFTIPVAEAVAYALGMIPPKPAKGQSAT